MRPSSCNRSWVRGRRRDGSASMAFQPGIKPFRLDPNRSAPTDARMPQFAPFARGVNGVATDAGIDRALSNGQPAFHGVPPRLPTTRRASELCCGLRSAAAAPDVLGPTGVYLRADAGSGPAPNRVERGFPHGAALKSLRCESSSNRSSVVLRKHGAWRDDLRKAKRCVREIEDLGRRWERAPSAGHHVRAKITRGAEALSRSEGLAYARSERSVEP
jgi:hypothetical protein